MGRSLVSRLVLIIIILLLAGSLTPPRVVLGQGATPTPAAGSPAAGYTYIVKRGDSWTRISRQTGVPIATLKLNNPQAVHPQDWLYEGERLFIPEPSELPPATPGAADGGYWYQVEPGDSWGSVARSTGATVQELWSANPSQVQPNRWLFIGQWLWIPGPDTPSAPAQIIPTATSQPTATPSPTATPQPTATPSPTATPQPTATPSPTATSSPTATPQPTATPSPTATPQPTATPSLTPMPTPTVETPVVEPAVVSPEAINAAVQAAATVAAAAESAATVAAAAESAATVVAAANSIATAAAIAQSAATSIAVLSTRVGMLALVTTPIVEAPTTTPWPTPTLEEPTATVVATATRPAPTATQPAPTATSEPSATPLPTATQPAPTVTRAPTRTRVAAAVATATRVPTRTPASAGAGTSEVCLVDKVIAANQAFDKWGREGFEAAIELYQAVLADTTSKACGKTANELELLRDYTRFRLLVSYVAGGEARQAEPLRDQIVDARLKGAADTFLDGLETSGSIVYSCRLVTEYVKGKPADWRWLTELGLPDKPADVCPLG